MSNCVFCRIVAKEIPAAVVYEDERTIAEPIAARLRADFGSHFPDVTVAAREVWHTVQRWETEHVDIAHDV